MRHVAVFPNDARAKPTRTVELPPLEAAEKMYEEIEGPGGFRIVKRRLGGWPAGKPRKYVLPGEDKGVHNTEEPDQPGHRWGGWEFVYGPIDADEASVARGIQLDLYMRPLNAGITLHCRSSGPTLNRKESADAKMRFFDLAVGQLKDMDSYYVLSPMALASANLFHKDLPRFIATMDSIEPVLRAKALVQDVALFLMRRGEAHEAAGHADRAILDYFDAFMLVDANRSKTAAPMVATALNYLGLALKRAGRFDAGREYFLKLFHNLSRARGLDADARKTSNRQSIRDQKAQKHAPLAQCHGCGVSSAELVSGTVPPGGKRRELKMCSRCRSVMFCSQECITEAWGRHKEACNRVRAERAGVVGGAGQEPGAAEGA